MKDRMMERITKNKLHTPRLLLRPFKRSDAPAMFAWASDHDVVRYLRFIPHSSVEESEQVIASWIKKETMPDSVNWAIVEAQSNTVIGSVGVIVTSSIDHKGEVGYCISKNKWGKGYMSEALPYVLSHAFTYMNLHRIEAAHSLSNMASGKVMEKAGMTIECPSLRHYYKGSLSGYQDSALYAAFSDTYKKIQ